MSVRTRATCLGGLLLALLCVPVLAAEPVWLKVSTPRYTVLSQLGPERTREWAREYDQFIDNTAALLQLQTTALPPLTVMIFARDADFTPYKPLRADGRIAPRLNAFFARRQTWAVAGVAGDATEGARELLFHEAVHWLTSTSYPNRYPVWLDEGLAQLLATFTVTDGGARWGIPDAAQLQLLRRSKLLPLDEMFTTHRDDELFASHSDASVFYAQSWALVHYLLLGPGRGQSGGIDTALLAGLLAAPSDVVLRERLGASAAQIETRLRNYLRQQRHARGSSALVPSAPTAQVTTPTAAEVQAALARLSLAGDHRRDALRHARRAVALDPANPSGYEVLAAHASWDPRTREAAAAHARRALEAGSRDAEMPLLMADALGDRDDAGAPDKARQRADLYLAAIALKPDWFAVHERLPLVLSDVVATDPRDLQALLLGRRLFPQKGMPLLGLAAIDRLAGDPAAARRHLAEALSLENGLTSLQARLARQLGARWDYEDIEAQVAALLARDQYLQAATLVDGLLLRLDDEALHDKAVTWRATLVIRERLRRAEAALRAGHRAEAQHIYEQLRTRVDLSGDMREWLVVALESAGG